MDLQELQIKLDYFFQDESLLEKALTHKSYAHEHKTEHNERFEFLGDAILQFVMSDALVHKYPDLPEGMLSKFRAVLVSEQGLTQVALHLDLGKFVKIGKGEEGSGGREKSSILSDATEAVFAAIYLDSKGQHEVREIRRIIGGLFAKLIEANEESFSREDFKTSLQEWVQKRKLGAISYQVINESGPDHDKTFQIQLLVDETVKGEGRGKNKKTAEQNAALAALKEYQKE